TEWAAALRGFWGTSNATWVNPPDTAAIAGNKLRQLERAAAHGLATPRTVVTNDAEEARAFLAACGGVGVAKALAAESYTEAGIRHRIFTRRVDAGSVEDLRASLRRAPVIFQEYVPKRVEIRATF